VLRGAETPFALRAEADLRAAGVVADLASEPGDGPLEVAVTLAEAESQKS